MEFLEDLKHAWGLKRKDTDATKQRILECYKDKEYENVIELCSKLDYLKEPLDSELGYALCYSIWAAPGNDAEAMGIAQKCVEFYDEPKFKEICSYAQEYWANQEVKSTKSFYAGKAGYSDVYSLEREYDKKIKDIIESSFKSPLETYSNALSWNHENDALRDRIKKKIAEAYRAWIQITLDINEVKASYDNPVDDKYGNLNIESGQRGAKVRIAIRLVIEIFEKALANKHCESYEYEYQDGIKDMYWEMAWNYRFEGDRNSESWKTRTDAIEDYESAIYWLNKRKDDTKEIEQKIETVKKQIAVDNNKFGKLLKEFPEASGFCNKLDKAGIKTVGDLLKTSDDEIDKIPKIGPSAMTEIRAFKNKF